MKCIKLIALSILASTLNSQAGVGHGNGVDITDFLQASAWFENTMVPLPPTSEGHPGGYGHTERTIRICYEQSENFKTDHVDLANLIQDTYDQWYKYMNRGTPIIGAPEVSSQPKYISINTLPCSKIRYEDYDLAVYFGVENEQVKKVIGSGQKPLAIAYKDRFDLESLKAYWSHGFIWINEFNYKSPNGNLPKKVWPKDHLYGVFLHEMGHIFGAQHVKSTIMDHESLLDIVAQELSYPAYFNLINLTEIDGQYELLPNDWSDIDFEGSLADSNELLTNFKTLVGRAPVGQFKFRLTGGIRSWKHCRWNQDCDRKNTLKIHVSDNLGENIFPIKLHDSGSFNSMAPRAFLYAYKGGVKYSYNFAGGGTRIHSGEITTKTGQKLLISYQRNGGNHRRRNMKIPHMPPGNAGGLFYVASPAAITFLDKDGWKDLFVSEPMKPLMYQ